MQHAENKIIANGYAFIRKHLPTNVTITNDWKVVVNYGYTI
jgi:hypothetical protein